MSQSSPREISEFIKLNFRPVDSCRVVVLHVSKREVALEGLQAAEMTAPHSHSSLSHPSPPALHPRPVSSWRNCIYLLGGAAGYSDEGPLSLSPPSFYERQYIITGPAVMNMSYSRAQHNSWRWR